MVATNAQWRYDREERIARLTEAAYQAVLDKGYRGSFLELELLLWRAIRLSIDEREQSARRLSDLKSAVAS